MKGKMAIFISHRLASTRFCDRIAVFRQGQIVEYGTPEELCLRYNQDKQYRLLLSDGSRLVLGQKAEDVGRLSRLLQEDKVNSLHSCGPGQHQALCLTLGKLPCRLFPMLI